MGEKKVDWSSGHNREALSYQRKGLWREDSLRMFAPWLGLRSGMRAIDVGCGLGYLGYTWWEFFGKGGEYIGIDLSDKLLSDAEKAAQDWAEGGTARFIRADACNVPLEDNSVDLAMCQTLLMHLEDPEGALHEMVRVVRPGGLVFCCEPDNLSAGLGRSFSSVPEFSLEDELFLKKITLTRYRGRLTMGKGDLAIGAKLPYLFNQAGLIDVDVRLNDQARFLLPPYESEDMKNRVEQLKKWFLDDSSFNQRLEEGREEFLAGGGDPEEYDRFRTISEKLRQAVQEQLDRAEYHSFASSHFYIAKARKRQ